MLDAAAHAALRRRLGGHRLPEGVADRLRAAASAVADDDPEGAAGHLVAVLGSGAGLTPAADDAVAGLLLTARALGALERVLDGVGDRVRRGAVGRTTAVSAGLLDHAAAGRAAPVVVAAVRCLGGGAGVEAALAGLWSLGHGSGADTARGLLVAADHAARFVGAPRAGAA